MPNITKKAIDTGKRPSKGQTFVWDTALIGFGIRITPGAVSFIAESRIQGVKRRMTLGRYPVMTVEEAREKAREFLSLMANGVDPTLQKRTDKVASITLKEVMEIYLARKELKATTVDVYRRQCNHAFKEWMDKPVTFITRDMVEDKHREMTNGTRRNGNSGRAYANGCFTTLQALLNFAGEKFTVDGQSLIPVNPVSRLTKTRAWYRVHPRTGVVPEHKIGAWYRAVRELKNKTVSDYFLLLLFTGLRRKEALTLRWTDIDFEAKTLIVRRQDSKTNRDHLLPLTEFLLDLLQERYAARGANPYVFPGRGKSHLTAFRGWQMEVRSKCGCDFMIHDLRRTYLSCAERIDLPYYVLKRLAGHKVSTDTLVPYIIVSIERLRVYAEKISRHFLDVVQDQAAVG